VTGGPPARQVRPQAQPRTLKDRLPDALAAAAGIWAAAALLLAVLIALAVTVAFILAVGLAVADAASYHEPRVRLGTGSTGESGTLPVSGWRFGITTGQSQSYY
jgi:hypothetical protein